MFRAWIPAVNGFLHVIATRAKEAAVVHPLPRERLGVAPAWMQRLPSEILHPKGGRFFPSSTYKPEHGVFESFEVINKFKDAAGGCHRIGNKCSGGATRCMGRQTTLLQDMQWDFPRKLGVASKRNFAC